MDTSTQATLLIFADATESLSVPSEMLQPHGRVRVVTPGRGRTGTFLGVQRPSPVLS